jgi:c-type cytochrome biogenesis protein CcmF
MLTLFSTIVQLQNRHRNRVLMPWVTVTLLSTAVFFLGLLVFVTDPFERLAVPAREGQDLNPLLQNYWMMIHPPSLYVGYVSAAVPFAFAMAALASGRLGDDWIRTTRRWALFCWAFLSLGNLLGARWAYEVLGWGGYWAWDPVENAAFMPWLVSTAYLHSIMIQEKKDMLKVWNMVLVLLTFVLTIFGTFLTRSGVISSVHSFTQSGLGPFFIGFLLLVIFVALGLLLYRLPELRTPATVESFLSRESAFLFNNLVLVGIAFAVFWGTVFPVLSEWVRGVKITVGPPFFNRVNTPLGVALLFLTGVGPVIAWRRASPRNLQRAFLWPVAAGLVAGVALWLGGMPLGYAHATFALSAFVLGTVVQEFWRGVRARQAMLHESAPRALSRLVGKNRRRYGGYVIHVGVHVPHRGAADARGRRGDAGREVPAPLRAPREPGGCARLAPPGRRLGVAGRGADRDPQPREALLQEAPAADHRGGDALDAAGRPLPRPRLVRPQVRAGDDPRLREPAGRVALDRRDRHGHRHRHHHVADAGRAARAGVRARPGAGAGRVSPAMRGAAVVLAAALLLAAAPRPAEPATQQEVEEALTCQCGCGLTVHSCNHLQCPSGEP